MMCSLQYIKLTKAIEFSRDRGMDDFKLIEAWGTRYSDKQTEVT